jgi:hypothetical protein
MLKKDVEQPYSAKNSLQQSYRLLVASRLYWLPYPGLLGKEVRFSAILGRSLLEVAKWKR